MHLGLIACYGMCSSDTKVISHYKDKVMIQVIYLQRGWATWTTGAVDKRVIGIVPIVMSELNLIKVCILYYIHVQYTMRYSTLIMNTAGRGRE